MKLLLDAHYSPVIASRLRERGYDVLAAGERQDLRQLPDPELLAWAAHDERILVTEDVVDFMALHRLHLLEGRIHAGILFTSRRRFPRKLDAVGPLVDALADFLEEAATGTFLIEGDVAWL